MARTGPNIRSIVETGSTNADLLAAARQGAVEGEWLRADRQTGGRGRLGRAWQSPTGNLHASTLVRLRATDPAAATLTLVAAVALDEAVAVHLRAVAAATIKWPNDLLIGGAKVAGILLERVEDAVVIGFGVNVAHAPDLPDRTTTSLSVQGVTVTLDVLVDTLAETFARWLARWRGEGVAPVRARWLEHAHAAGTALVARLPDGDAVDGLFDGLTAEGALILRLAGGERRVVHAADVFLL